MLFARKLTPALASQILGEWIAIEDLVYFDLSVCNRAERPELIKFVTICRCQCVDKRASGCYVSLREADWLKARGRLVVAAKALSSEIFNAHQFKEVKLTCESIAAFENIVADQVCHVPTVQIWEIWFGRQQMKYEKLRGKLETKCLSVELMRFVLQTIPNCEELVLYGTQIMFNSEEFQNIFDMPLGGVVKHLELHCEEAEVIDVDWLLTKLSKLKTFMHTEGVSNFCSDYECSEYHSIRSIETTDFRFTGFTEQLLTKLTIFSTEKLKLDHYKRLVHVYGADVSQVSEYILSHLSFQPAALIIENFDDETATTCLQPHIAKLASSELKLLSTLHCSGRVVPSCVLTLLAGASQLCKLWLRGMPAAEYFQRVVSALWSTGACATLSIFHFHTKEHISLAEEGNAAAVRKLGDFLCLTEFHLECSMFEDGADEQQVATDFTSALPLIRMMLARNPPLLSVSLPYQLASEDLVILAPQNKDFFLQEVLPLREIWRLRIADEQLLTEVACMPLCNIRQVLYVKDRLFDPALFNPAATAALVSKCIINWKSLQSFFCSFHFHVRIYEPSPGVPHVFLSIDSAAGIDSAVGIDDVFRAIVAVHGDISSLVVEWREEARSAAVVALLQIATRCRSLDLTLSELCEESMTCLLRYGGGAQLKKLSLTFKQDLLSSGRQRADVVAWFKSLLRAHSNLREFTLRASTDLAKEEFADCMRWRLKINVIQTAA